MLRGQPGRNLGDNERHDQALVGAERSRVGIRLGLLPLASRMTTRERAAGKSLRLPFYLSKEKVDIMWSTTVLVWIMNKDLSTWKCPTGLETGSRQARPGHADFIAGMGAMRTPARGSMPFCEHFPGEGFVSSRRRRDVCAGVAVGGCTKD